MIKNVVLQKCGAKVLLFLQPTKYFSWFSPKWPIIRNLFLTLEPKSNVKNEETVISSPPLLSFSGLCHAHAGLCDAHRWLPHTPQRQQPFPPGIPGGHPGRCRHHRHRCPPQEQILKQLPQVEATVTWSQNTFDENKNPPTGGGLVERFLYSSSGVMSL